MLYNCVKVIGVDGIEDVEEVVSAWVLLINVLILKVDFEDLVVLQVLPKMFYRKFLEVADVNVVHLLLLQEPLLVDEYLPQEVLVYLRFWWEIILYYMGVRSEYQFTYGVYQGKRKNRALISVCLRVLGA